MATWTEFHSDYVGSEKELIMKAGTLSLSTEGGTIGDIPASLFGLTKIISIRAEGSDGPSSINNSVRFLLVPNRENVLTTDVETVTDASRGNSVDVTMNVITTVIGY